MKLTSLATLTATLIVRHVYASPAEDVLSPSGIPATSGLPFSTLSFDTTAAPSILSALSSLISSESTAVTPPPPPSASMHTSSGGGVLTTYVTNTPSASPTTTAPSTITTLITASTPTSGARSSRDVRSGSVVVGVVVGAVAVAALV